MSARTIPTELAGTTALDHLVYGPRSGDDRRLTMALAATAALHLALLAVVLPTEPDVPRDEPVRVAPAPLTTYRIKKEPPPPVTTPKPKPRPRARTIPIPAPPDPEPIVEPATPVPEPVPLAVPDLPTVPIPAPPPAPPAPVAPLRVGAGVELPARTVFVEPRYTEAARRIRLEGMVILDTIIDREGRIRNVQVLRGLGLGLSDAAIEAVSKWRFEPPRVDGKPVELAYVVTVNFRLR